MQPLVDLLFGARVPGGLTYPEVVGRNNLRLLRTFFATLFAANFIWGFTDRAIIGPTFPDFDALFRHRFNEGLVLLLAYGLMRLPHGPRTLIPTAALASFLVAAHTSYVVGEFGPPSGHWLSTLIPSPIAVVAVLGPNRNRAAISLSILGGVLYGYWGLHPAFWSDPATLYLQSVFVFIASMGLFAGHYTEGMRRHTHAIQVELASEKSKLEALNQTLEDRVRSRTTELRALAERLDTANEAERMRLAREIHDGLGQELGAVRYALAATRRRYATEPGAVERNLEELERLLEGTSDTMRRIMLDLRPRILDRLGLVPAVEWLAERTSDRTGIPCTVTFEGDVATVPEELTNAAFRLAQESLRNVERHARATRIDVAVTISGDALSVEVTDDGIGVDATAKPTTGLGIVGMRERAEALGGTFQIGPAGVRGTRVRARLPRPQTPAASP